MTNSERRKGVASILLGKVEAWASSDPECTALYLHVIDYNRSAMRFYERLGLQQFNRVVDFYPINGENHDAFIYVLYINGGTPPPPEPPGIMEQVLDWFSNAFSRVLGRVFGENDVDEEEEEEFVKEDELV